MEEKNVALEGAKKLYKTASQQERGLLEDIFPELKEFRSEEINRILIEYFQRRKDDGDEDEIFCGLSYDEVLAWLEEQGKQKPIFHIGDKIKHRTQGITAVIQDIKDGEYILTECYGSHLPIKWQNSYELVGQKESKFKVGDWVVCEASGFTGMITEVDKEYIRVLTPTMTIDVVGDDKKLRPWSIEDAKPGDILATPDYLLIFKEHLKDDGGVSYCHYDLDGSIFDFSEDSGWYFGEKATLSPATKEQCDFLKQKMHEAGYEWDSEKLELKEIKHSRLNKEDLVSLANITTALIKLKGDKDPSFETCGIMISRLKAIRDNIFDFDLREEKLEWTEHDESMYIRCLGAFAGCLCGHEVTEIDDELEWLKSLKVCLD